MSNIILEATLHEEHNGAGEGREVRRAEPRAPVKRLLHIKQHTHFLQGHARRG